MRSRRWSEWGVRRTEGREKRREGKIEGGRREGEGRGGLEIKIVGSSVTQ